jgi:hypothetical protein
MIEQLAQYFTQDNRFCEFLGTNLNWRRTHDRGSQQGDDQDTLKKEPHVMESSRFRQGSR